MGLDIYFHRIKNGNATVTKKFAEFWQQFNDEAPLADTEKFAKELGIADRIKLTDKPYSYTDEQGEEKESRYTEVERTDQEEVAYFRKHNHLVEFFGYEDNCSNIVISKSQIEDCISACKTVLEHYGKNDFEDIAEEMMPTSSGFFFGSTEYDEYYKDKLEDDVKQFEKILKETDWNTDQIEMHCWW